MNASPCGSAAWIADCLDLTTGYGQLLAGDIPAEQFAHMPAPGMNHPAFCFGHVTLSTGQALALIGRSDLVVEPDGYAALFGMGVECVEQDGRYPAMEAILDWYLTQHRAAAGAIRGVSDEALTAASPPGGMLSERLPTVGALLNFAVHGHHMVHLGQISAWRRAMGLGPVL